MTAAFTGGMTTTMPCFVAGTYVLTKNGRVAIERIKPDEEDVTENGIPKDKFYVKYTLF